jgi:hypothetical protein
MLCLTVTNWSGNLILGGRAWAGQIQLIAPAHSIDADDDDADAAAVHCVIDLRSTVIKI